MWIFFIMAFQAMLIVAWNSGSLLGFFDEDVFRTTLDIILSFSSWGSLKVTQILRYLLKFAIAAFWAVVLPVGYSSSVQNPMGLVKLFSSWAKDWQNDSFYNYAVPKLYVGRAMHEDFFSLLKYTMFWILLLISKLAFSYYVEILPLIQPTKIIMDLHVDNYQWHEFFSEVTHNIGVVIAIWSPIVLVYFMDAQIWYAIFSTLFGGIHGAFSHLCEIQTLGMLRPRFESVPAAFCCRLVPLTNQCNRKRHLDNATERNIASFYHVWNKFIHSMRMQDLVSNRDRDLLLLPSFSSDVSVIQWPLFLLASKISDSEDAYRFRSQIINVLQDIMEIITQDVMVNGNEILGRAHLHDGSAEHDKREQRFEKINISLPKMKVWREKINRLYLLLTIKESAINVPPNLEARRRITFFANSLFMNMPSAPKVRDMLSFSVLTPYYKEYVLYSDEELTKENEDGISILFYLQRIYPDEWKNFLERMHTVGIKDENQEARMKEETRKWVSYRAQTLSRTVRGMMYYRQALELQFFLECSGDSAILGGFQAFEEDPGYYREDAQALVNMKFTYVVSCQVYGAQKKSSDARDRSCNLNILNLMLTYPSLRVAYIDEREETVNGRSQRVYYSVLVKGGEKLDKDNYFEEAYKMRNVLEEFIKPRRKEKKPSILGPREHIFTGSVSSLAWFMSNQDTSFVTMGQRILANPLRYLLEAKVANGNGEQTLSGDVYRLGRRFDFYRMLSFYFTTVGFYFSSMVTVLTVYVFLYGRLYMVMSGLEREIFENATIHQSKALEEALATQSVFQLGLLLVMPMVMEIGLEKGFRIALCDFIIMQLQLASVFFTFELGTKAHYYGRTILHGGSKYRATGRGFVVFHAKFAVNYRLYSRSHFVKGLELLILLVLYEVYGESYRGSSLYWFISLHVVPGWILVVCPFCV
ncbi:hypothetical protein CRYUN_Cryun24cG0089100 [Craigia yunnanensis]